MFRERKNKRHCSFTTFNIPFFSSNSLNAKSLNYFSRKKAYTFNHNRLKEWLIQPLQKWLPIATQQFFSLPLSISIEDSLVTENGRTIEVWSCISDWDLHRIDIHCSKEVEMHNNNWIDTINWGLQCFFDNLYDN